MNLTNQGNLYSYRNPRGIFHKVDSPSGNEISDLKCPKNTKFGVITQQTLTEYFDGILIGVFRVFLGIQMVFFHHYFH